MNKALVQANDMLEYENKIINDMLEYENKIIKPFRDDTFLSEYLKKQIMLLIIICRKM